MYALGKLLHKHVHVVTPPIGNIAYSVAVLSELAFVGDGTPCRGVWVEVVVDVYSVDVVAADDVADNVADVVTVGRYARVENEESVVCEHTFRVLYGDVCRCKVFCAFCLCPIRIEPCVYFHTSFVALFRHPCQRVPTWVWCFALCASKEATPRFVGTVVEGVALGTHLKDDGIHAVLLKFVKLMCEVLLHGSRRESLKLPIDALYPCAAKFSFGCCCSRFCRGFCPCCHAEYQAEEGDDGSGHFELRVKN